MTPSKDTRDNRKGQAAVGVARRKGSQGPCSWRCRLGMHVVILPETVVYVAIEPRGKGLAARAR